MRVVFDTNIYISAFIFPGSSAEDALLRCIDGQHGLLISKPILEETIGILARKFSRDREQLARTALFLDEVCELVKPDICIDELDDKPDNRILECAIAGEADAIVTGDKAMLNLGHYQQVKLLSLREFIEISEL